MSTVSDALANAITKLNDNPLMQSSINLKAYQVYFGNTLMPVTPEEISMKIKGQNKTIKLINQGEVNVINPSGLTEISLKLLLPNRLYPFAQYKNGVYLGANHFLDLLEGYKLEKKSFQFIVIRAYPSGEAMYNTNITVTIEEYTIDESYKQGNDVVVSVKLKQYVNYGTKTAVIKKKNSKKKVKKKKSRSNSSKKKVSTYIVKKGDTLFKIAKKLLGDGSKCWNLAKLNGLSNPNQIYVGQKLIIQDVASCSGESGATKRKTSSGKTTRSTNKQASKTTSGTPRKYNNGLAGVSLAMDNYYNSGASSSGSSGYKPYQGYSAYTYYQTKIRTPGAKTTYTIPGKSGQTLPGGGGVWVRDPLSPSYGIAARW